MTSVRRLLGTGVLVSALGLVALAQTEATLLGREAHIGAIQPGRQADIIAVATSPLDDVTVLERVRFVMRNGVVHILDGARQPFPPR